MRKRPASEEEKNLFRKTIDQTRPQLAVKSRARKSSAKSGAGAMDGSTRKKLQQGELKPGARLDLHGFTQDAAHRGILAFLSASHTGGLKLVLIITGQGGVLKEMVPRWLREPGFSGLIAGTEPAHIRHGGAGALYVYLRK